MTEAREDSEPSVRALLADLASETALLVRAETRLVGVELTTKAKRGARDIALLGAGGAVVHAGVLFLLAAIVVALRGEVPMWLTALFVGGVAVGIGVALMVAGFSALRTLDPTPRRTVETLRDNKLWLKGQLHGQP